MYQRSLLSVAVNAAFDSYNLNLFARDTIAGAVAREARILRRNIVQQAWNERKHRRTTGVYVKPKIVLGDGYTYKAAWERKGSYADKHITAAWKDYEIMARFVRHDWHIAWNGTVHISASRENVHQYTP